MNTEITVKSADERGELVHQEARVTNIWKNYFKCLFVNDDENAARKTDLGRIQSRMNDGNEFRITEVIINGIRSMKERKASGVHVITI